MLLWTRLLNRKRGDGTHPLNGFAREWGDRPLEPLWQPGQQPRHLHSQPDLGTRGGDQGLQQRWADGPAASDGVPDLVLVVAEPRGVVAAGRRQLAGERVGRY